tara:strand:- start:449 stop:580 length:132 start_codon:yes stop_codon:yes gene_type:complete
MIFALFASLIAIIIYLICSFALYKFFLQKGNNYINRYRKDIKR